MKLAVIGDIHGFWDARDTDWFNRSDYDCLLFVGDFAPWTGSLPVARMLAGITKPAWAIAGNHDAVTPLQLYAAIRHWRWLSWITGLRMDHRVRRLAKELGAVRLRGYALEPLAPDLGLLVARPHAMGPDWFYYRGYLKRRFGVADFASSAARLKALVDRAPARLLILAHNGPAGLGNTPDAPFGCDFNPTLGDFGDPDLRVAIDHAHASGRTELAVIAGHMHHRQRKGGSTRATWFHDGKTLYVNAAYVPRMRRDGSRRHHVALYVDGDGVRAETVFVDAGGRIQSRVPIGPDSQPHEFPEG